MKRRQPLGDTGPQYAVPKTRAGPSGICLMEIHPNSGTDTPCPITCSSCPAWRSAPACLERERARTYRMSTCWDGPRYPAFSNYSLRLRSFAKGSWPHRKRSPNSFSAAGFFYTGKDLCVSAATTTIIYSVLVPSTLHSHLSIVSLQGTLRRPTASIVAEDLRDGWVTTMTRGRSTSHGFQTVSTFDTLWTETSNALILMPVTIATYRLINVL